jgi:L-cystine uptake protein TcyP (sodium:dicarboxylate symporter family)
MLSKETYHWVFTMYTDHYISLSIKGLMQVRWFKGVVKSHRYFFAKASLAELYPPHTIEHVGAYDEQEFAELEFTFFDEGLKQRDD